MNLGEPDTGVPATATSARDKAAVRRALLAARTRRDEAQRQVAGQALAGWASQLPSARVVAGFVGVGTEPPTLPLLRALEAGGAEVLLPVIRPGRRLDWAALPARDDALLAGPMGLHEPPPPHLGEDALARAELVLVPALAVDRTGRRLGRGGGFYDRALAGLTTAAVRLAVVFDDEVLDAVPVEPHDQPVSGALTPSGLLLPT